MSSLRMKNISSAVFFELARHKEQLRAKGRRVIDLGIGSPDLPPPAGVMQALEQALHSPEAYRYAGTDGAVELRHAVTAYMNRRFGAQVDPDLEVLALIGAQDGLAHLPLALVDPGDVILVPDPGYPIYFAAAHLAGAVIETLPLRPENNYRPDFSAIAPDILRRTKMMVLNYPHNPTAATAPLDTLKEAVGLADRHGFLVVHDAAYAELVMDGSPAASLLQVDGGKEVGLELHSLSKTFNFAGARAAFAVGNRDALVALRTLKSQIDYGVFLPIQAASVAALEDDGAFVAGLCAEYRRRRDAFLAPLHKIGWEIAPPSATMFVWARIPDGRPSREFAANLLEESGVVCVPGSGFGAHGEGFIRFALVQPPDVLSQAAQDIAAILR